MTQRYTIGLLADFFRGEHIAIIGNGPSVVQTNKEGRRTAPVFDVTKATQGHLWTVNGGWHYHPSSVMGFQMDDVKGPAMAAHPNGDWYTSLVREAKIPIITQQAYEDFPSTVSFPLEDALRYFYPRTYYAESISYMIQLAIMFGVKRIDFLGVDYQMDPVTKSGIRPQERACTEYWIGQAEARGIECHVMTRNSNILKPIYDWEEGFYMPGFYGYSEQNFPLRWQGNPADMNIHISNNPNGEIWWSGTPNLWKITGGPSDGSVRQNVLPENTRSAEAQSVASNGDGAVGRI